MRGVRELSAGEGYVLLGRVRRAFALIALLQFVETFPQGMGCLYWILAVQGFGYEGCRALRLSKFHRGKLRPRPLQAGA